MQSDQSEDPRWQRFSEREWRCSSCGLTHTGLFDLACDYPDFWRGNTENGPNSAVVTENVLTEDFCIIGGQHYFVRCVLELPLVGWAGEAFGFGVWATLSEKNFALYREAFDGGQ